MSFHAGEQIYAAGVPDGFQCTFARLNLSSGFCGMKLIPAIPGVAIAPHGARTDTSLVVDLIGAS